MKYKSVSAYWTIDEAKKGNVVYVLDKKTKQVLNLNELMLDTAISVINAADKDPNRFEFWTEEKENAEDETV